MKILVCMSNVPDTTTKVKFRDGNTAFDDTGVQWVINPWDELALTRALELKEGSGGVIDKVTVINAGGKETEPTIRKALAIGADDAVRIDADPRDAFQVAAQLASWIRSNPYDLIMCGVESSDYNGGAVGGMLAEMLDISSVSAVSGVDFSDGNFIIKREIDGGNETVATATPLLVVVQKGIAIAPRIPSMRGIMMARTKPLLAVPQADAVLHTSHEEFELPPARKACRMVSPDNVAELVNLLQNEAKII